MLISNMTAKEKGHWITLIIHLQVKVYDALFKQLDVQERHRASAFYSKANRYKDEICPQGLIVPFVF